ncbi:hypothetical protein Y032_0565g5 [Ancylostoma ceylanicum]|nr:hypothetical protein Y032_0565g5 [Ancylostoma ceylanicum]
MPRSFINFSWVSPSPSNIWRIVGYVLLPGLEFMVIFRFSADEVVIVGSTTTLAVYNPDVYCHWTPSIIVPLSSFHSSIFEVLRRPLSSQLCYLRFLVFL